MRKVILFLTLCLSLSSLSAQNTAPVVTNVTFEQRTDGSFIVDVYYDVNDDDGDLMSVTMYASADAGATWDFSLLQVGANITSGTGKHIVWDFGAGHPQTFSDQIQIKIIADDNPPIGTLTDIDGNVYQTVKIGDQWWMADNLKVTHYSNGDLIPNVTIDWGSLSTGAYCVYNDDDNNAEIYGLLYNWYAVDDARNIAPAGWHIPSDEEWKELEMYLGMSQSAADATGYRGTDEGGKMKEVGLTHWTDPNYGATNSSGFNALPGGYRNQSTFFHNALIGLWWSTTSSSGSQAWYRELSYSGSTIQHSPSNNINGMSIRCVRD